MYHHLSYNLKILKSSKTRLKSTHPKPVHSSFWGIDYTDWNRMSLKLWRPLVQRWQGWSWRQKLRIYLSKAWIYHQPKCSLAITHLCQLSSAELFETKWLFHMWPLPSFSDQVSPCIIIMMLWPISECFSFYVFSLILWIPSEGQVYFAVCMFTKRWHSGSCTGEKFECCMSSQVVKSCSYS